MPLGESMLSTIRSNKSVRLDKSKHFKKVSNGYSKKQKLVYDFPEASEELLFKNKIKVHKTKQKN